MLVIFFFSKSIRYKCTSVQVYIAWNNTIFQREIADELSFNWLSVMSTWHTNCEVGTHTFFFFYMLLELRVVRVCKFSWLDDSQRSFQFLLWDDYATITLFFVIWSWSRSMFQSQCVLHACTSDRRLCLCPFENKKHM